MELHELPPMLLVFNQPGPHFDKELTRWLTDEQHKSAHVHVLINCVIESRSVVGQTMCTQDQLVNLESRSASQ